MDFTSRAIEVDSNFASAYAVRALGRILVDPEDWAGALLDMEAALGIAPSDTFYGEAVEFLRRQETGASG